MGGVGVAVAGAVVNSALFNVEGGHRAVIFDRFTGVKKDVVGEGTHFMIPWSRNQLFMTSVQGQRTCLLLPGLRICRMLILL